MCCRAREKPVQAWGQVAPGGHADWVGNEGSKGRVAHDGWGTAASGARLGWLGPRRDCFRRNRGRGRDRELGCGTVRQLDRCRRQSPRRSRDHSLLFPSGARRAARRRQDRRGAEGALRDRPVPGRPHQPVRRPPGRDRGREPGHQPRRLRGQQETQGRAAHQRGAVQAARHAVAADWCRPTPSASSKSTAATAASTCASTRRSSNCRTTASISCSRSRKARRPASRRSSSSATRPIPTTRLQGRDQDIRKTIPVVQLPAVGRHLRSRSHRGRSRSAAPLLSQARLRRRARGLGGRGLRSACRRASSSPSRSTKASAIGSARSRCVSNVPAVDPQLALWPAADVGGRRLQRRSRREVGREPVDRSGPARLSVRGGPAARRPRCGDCQRSTSPIVVEEGPRVYIERINIRGNTRTRDYVIRREFDLAEGDAYNRALIDRAERRLKNLNYFKTVKITNEPGSAPDRIVHQRRRRGAVDRRVLGLRRLFDRRRLHGRSQRRRAQSAGPRPVRQGRRSVRPARAGLRTVLRRAVLHGLSRVGRRRHLPARSSLPRTTFPTKARRSAAGCGPASP